MKGSINVTKHTKSLTEGKDMDVMDMDLHGTPVCHFYFNIRLNYSHMFVLVKPFFNQPEDSNHTIKSQSHQNIKIK